MMGRTLFAGLALFASAAAGAQVPLSQSPTFTALRDRVVAAETGKVAIPSGASVTTNINGPQPHEGGLGTSARPGYKFFNFTVPSHYPAPGVTNQQDSILYIEGHVPAVNLPLDNEYAGVRVNMSSAATGPSAALRGYHATVTGEGGHAKLRAIRTTTIGMDGHDGLVIGGLFTATRTGIIPFSVGGDGVAAYTADSAGPYPNQDYAIYAAAGPGIRGTLLLGGQTGKNRPQTGIQQARGAQALMPEIAFMDTHGGGRGRVWRHLKDEDDATVIASIERDGSLRIPRVRSNMAEVAVPTDSVVTITPPGGNGFLKFWLDNVLTVFGEIKYRTETGGGSGAAASNLFGSATVLGTTDVPLTGATGGAGKVTIAVVGDSIQIENRLGVTRNLGYLFIGN